jgi:hypothetical protein
MTVDIATLGLAVDTQGLKQGEAATNATTEAMKRAETAATGLEQGVKKAGTSTAQAMGATAEAMRRTEASIAGVEQGVKKTGLAAGQAMIAAARDAVQLQKAQADLAATTARATAAQRDYEAAMKGTNTEKQAAAAIKLQQARAAQTSASFRVEQVQAAGLIRLAKEQEAEFTRAERARARAAKDTEAEIARAEKAKQAAFKETAATQRRAYTEGAVIGALVVQLSGMALRAADSFVKLGLEVGKYQDIAEKTGSNDPAGLASMQTAADVAGTSVENIGQAINRLTQNLAKSTGSEKGVEKALERINIEVAAFKKLAPEQQYREIAKQLDNYADGQGKVAVAQALFGRGGAEQLVVLKELARQRENLIKLSNAEIRAADDVADSIARQRSESRQLTQLMATAALPAVEAITGAWADMLKSVLEWDKETKGIDTSGIQDFAFTVARLFGFMGDAARISGAIVLTYAKLVGAGAAVLSTQAEGIGDVLSGQATKRAVRNAREVFSAWREEVEKMGESLTRNSLQDAVEKHIAGIQARVANAKARLGTTGDFARQDRNPDRNLDDFKNVNEEIDKQRDAYERLMDRVKGFTATQREEASSIKQLTAGQKLAIQVQQELDKAKLKASDTQRTAINAALQEALAAEKQAIWMEKRRQQLEENIRLQDRAFEQVRREAVQAEEAAKTAEREVNYVGQTNRMLAELEAGRLRQEAALIRTQVAMAEGRGFGDEYNNMLLRQAAAIERSAAALSRRSEAEENSQFQQRATDAARQQRDQSEELAKSAEREADAYGKTALQLDALETKRMRDAAAMLRMHVVMERAENGNEQYNRLLLQQADALDKAAAARDRRAAAEKRARENASAGTDRAMQDFVDEARNKGSEAESTISSVIDQTERGITDLFRGSKQGVKSLIDFMISEFFRLRVIKPVLAEILGSTSGDGMGSLIKDLFNLIVGGMTGATDTGSGTGDFSRMDRAAGSSLGSSQGFARPEGRQQSAPQTVQSSEPRTMVFQAGPTYISIDSRTDQQQVAQLVSEGVAEGNRQFAEQLSAKGAI